MRYYAEEVSAVETELNTSVRSGLQQEAMKENLEKYGENKLNEKRKKTFIQRFIAQFKDLLVIILLLAAIISFIIGERIDAIVIMAIVIINALLGVVQEQRAEASIDAIKKMSAPNAKVIRNGQQHIIPSEQVVVGDLVILDAGDFVPADLRLIEAASLQIEESSLTGESVPTEKNTNVLDDVEIGVGDRTNMAFSGSVVTYGRGRGLVTAVGMQTEIGHIAKMLDDVEEQTTPLQKKLEEVGRILAVIAIVICIAIFVLSYIQSGDLSHSFLIAISLAVAAIPEGLTVIVTIVLALGIQEMARNKAIMRSLPAVETAGSASVICSDKTGTLTQNKMTVVRAYTNMVETDLETFDTTNQTSKRFAEFGVLCNDTQIKVTGSNTDFIGDPTETGLVDFAFKIGMNPLELKSAHARLNEIPFDSDRKLMTTVNKLQDAYVVITKGAPDVFIAKSTAIEINGRIEPFTEQLKNQVIAQNEMMAKQALRVLAVGYRHIEEADVHTITIDNAEHDFVFLGLYGIIDPAREEAKPAIAECFMAGIKPVMITGDHQTTAVAIAKNLGILHDEKESMSGAELELLSDEELFHVVPNYSVYARVSPEHKVRIVQAWQKHGKVVAMTGDGVNDAPALKNSDIGVAMGITGTEVAKGAADMVLADDNFVTIVQAVKVGRVVFENIRKAIQFLLSSNVGEIVAILLGILFLSSILHEGASLLEPTQILWINLVTDSFLAIALGLERGEAGLMKEKPRDPSANIFSGGLGGRILYQGLMIGILTFSAYYIGYQMAGGVGTSVGSIVHVEAVHVAQTMAFMTLAFVQFVHVFNVRSMQKSIFTIGFFSNKWVNLAVLASMLLQLATLLPGVREIFGIVPIGLEYWAVIIMLALIPLVIVEIEKRMTR